MKLLLGLSLLSIGALPVRAQAQVLCALGPSPKGYDAMADMPASPNVQRELKKVRALLCAKGCATVFIVANSTTPNAATVSDGLGVSKIAYSPTFLNAVRTSYGPNATLGILAHELGHHLESTANRATWMKDAWDGELRADAWAGCALAKADLKGPGLQSAMSAMSTYPSAAHPPWIARLPAIAAGYSQCGGDRTLALASRDDAADPGANRGANRGANKGEAQAALGEPGGCTRDRGCRNGRACLGSHCAVARERGRCGKDTDCPEPQECTPAGRCEGAAEGSDNRPGGGASGDPAGPPQPKEEVRAALQEKRSPPTAPVRDPGACSKSCDETRNQCVEAANGDLSRCLGAIRAHPSYNACSCPNYPEGNFACYRFCTTAYEQGKTCSTEDRVRGCTSDGERCRARCP